MPSLAHFLVFSRCTHCLWILTKSVLWPESNMTQHEFEIKVACNGIHAPPTTIHLHWYHTQYQNRKWVTIDCGPFRKWIPSVWAGYTPTFLVHSSLLTTLVGGWQFPAWHSSNIHAHTHSAWLNWQLHLDFQWCGKIVLSCCRCMEHGWELIVDSISAWLTCMDLGTPGQAPKWVSHF